MHKENWFFCLNFFSSPLGLWQIMPRALEASLALRWTRWTRVPWASSIKAKRRGMNPRKVTAVGTRCEHFIFLKNNSYFDHGWSACKQTVMVDYFIVTSGVGQITNKRLTQQSHRPQTCFVILAEKKKWLIWILGSERWSVWRTDGDIYAELILHTGELLSLILIIYYIICDWSLKGVIIGWVLLL